MSAVNPVVLALILSIFLIVFSLGTRSTLDDALWLFRRPLQFLRAMIAIYAIVPAFAITLCLVVPLPPPVQLALVALAVSPLPPILPNKQMKMGAEQSYTIGLLVAASLFALVATPLLITIAADILGVSAALSPLKVARTLLITVGAPLAAGMVLKAYAPAAADLVERFASIAGKMLLLLGLLVVLFVEWREIISLIGNGALLAIGATVAVGLAAGHLLAGGSGRERAALAVAAATRHPGVAIAIATVNFADWKQLAIAAVLLFLLVNVIVTIPYVRWTKRHSSSPAEASQTS